MRVVVIFPVIFLADRKLSQLMESVHNWESCVLFVDTAVFLQITTKIKTIYPPDQILTPLTCTMYAVVQWLESGTPTRTIRVRFPSDWLLHHGDNRGRHSANHNLLPDMHLRVPVLRVKTCRDSRLV